MTRWLFRRDRGIHFAGGVAAPLGVRRQMEKLLPLPQAERRRSRPCVDHPPRVYQVIGRIRTPEQWRQEYAR